MQQHEKNIVMNIIADDTELDSKKGIIKIILRNEKHNERKCVTPMSQNHYKNHFYFFRQKTVVSL